VTGAYKSGREDARSPMIERPRGTRDFTPDETAKRRWAEGQLRRAAESYGYREIATPTFENLDLFLARSGPNVVNESYVFKDKGGRDLILRPELTAPTMRMFASEMRAWPRPVKVFYYGPVFRYEEPQMGRYREFWQFGVELIGADTPEADAEVISVAYEGIRALGITDMELRVGHIGIARTLVAAAGLDEPTRLALFGFIDKKDFEKLEARLDAAGVAPGLSNLLMKVARFAGGRREVDAISKDLAEFPAAHQAVERLKAVVDALDRRGIRGVRVDLGVVRGLDYYTGVVFEFHSDKLGAESQCGGGGAYSLTELFGLPPEGTVGFGLGFDRLVLVAPDENAAAKPPRLHVLVIPIGADAKVALFAGQAEHALRAAGLRVERDLLGRGPSKSLKYADARGAQFAVLIGDKEAAEAKVTLRDLKSGEQTLLSLQEAVARAAAAL
jgi:histidyl-tRNA synthetase